MLPKEMIPWFQVVQRMSLEISILNSFAGENAAAAPVQGPELPLGSPGRSRGCVELAGDGGGQRKNVQVCWGQEGVQVSCLIPVTLGRGF